MHTINGITRQLNYKGTAVKHSFTLCANTNRLPYRRLIPKSAFMHFLAILTFLHIWKDKSGLFENARVVAIFAK